MNPIYRTVLSLSVVVPLLLFFLVGYSGILADLLNSFFPADWPMSDFKGIEEFLIVVFGFFVVYLLGRLFRLILIRLGKTRSSERIRLNTKKRLGMNSLTDFLPYILLFVFSQNEVQGAFSWMAAIFLLLLLAWSSSVISYSPLLELCGMKFYEVTTAKGETLIVIDSKDALTLGVPLDLVRITEVCYIRK